MSTTPRRRVGRYELLRVIGRGGTAIVYLAHQLDLDRRVALKELSAFHASDPAFAERFMRESRLAGSLSHPNLVTVHDYFEHEGVPYIAMELLEQGSMRPHVRSLTLAQAAGVLEGTLAGLTHAESREIVHRDMKPENLMVTDDGRVKIADFGIAKATGTAAQGAFMTATGTTVGTPAYMAPEQATASGVSARTDLYSVGVMAYEMLVGDVPFSDPVSPMAVLLKHVRETPPRVRSMNPEVDPRIDAWVASLLEKEPEDRPATAADAWDELEDVLLDLLGPRWRREARLQPEAASQGIEDPRPLTPAPFHEPAEQDEAFQSFAWGRAQTPAPGGRAVPPAQEAPAQSVSQPTPPSFPAPPTIASPPSAPAPAAIPSPPSVPAPPSVPEPAVPVPPAAPVADEPEFLTVDPSTLRAAPPARVEPVPEPVGEPVAVPSEPVVEPEPESAPTAVVPPPVEVEDEFVTVGRAVAEPRPAVVEPEPAVESELVVESDAAAVEPASPLAPEPTVEASTEPEPKPEPPLEDAFVTVDRAVPEQIRPVVASAVPEPPVVEPESEPQPVAEAPVTAPRDDRTIAPRAIPLPEPARAAPTRSRSRGKSKPAPSPRPAPAVGVPAPPAARDSAPVAAAASAADAAVVASGASAASPAGAAGPAFAASTASAASPVPTARRVPGAKRAAEPKRTREPKRAAEPRRVREPKPAATPGEPSERSPVALAVVVAVIALLVGVGLAAATSGGGDPAPKPTAANPGSEPQTIGPGQLVLPAGLRPSSDTSLPGVALRNAGAASGSGGRLVIGLQSTPGPTLAPASLTSEKVDRVEVAGVPAVRYQDVSGVGGPVVAVPTTTGILTAVCVGSGAFTARCISAIASMTPAEATAQPAGPTDDFRTQLADDLDRFGKPITAAQQRLAGARTRAGQASSAAGLQRAYGAAAKARAGRAASAWEAGAQRVLVGALRDGQKTAAALAGAAGRGDRDAYTRARKKLLAAGKAVTTAVGGFTALGYGGAGG